jgi:hypothetical protein
LNQPTGHDLYLDLASMSGNPLAWVLWAFPWGEAGTQLERFLGPEEWQALVLGMVRDGLLTLDEAIQIAVASGHGVGKSSLVAWLILWAISTKEDTRGVVTANTENQLKTKTWAELGKWYNMCRCKDMFKLTATAIFSSDKERERTWRIDMVPWSERNTEAFQGLHNEGKRILLVFDEGSAIPDLIWEVSEGALTDVDTEIIWCVFGNPTRNVGRFRECFPGQRHAAIWKTFQVDSRTVSITNKKQIDKWLRAYGEDDDFCRVRVRGVFPRTGLSEFISAEVVAEAALRELPPDYDANGNTYSRAIESLVMGVDVARFGDDESVICLRRGRDARTVQWIFLRGADTVQLTGKIIEVALSLGVTDIFVDEGGVGGGVVDMLRHKRMNVIGVQFGSKSDNFTVQGDQGNRYANKRAEMWGACREWLKGGCIPDDPELRAQLVGPMYGFNLRDEIQLEKKEDMKDRGLSSPDRADALVLTFAYPVAPRALQDLPGSKPLVESEYNPFSPERMGYAQDYNPFAHREAA